MIFGLPFGGGMPNNLSNEDVMKSVSTLPSEIIDIIELYEVDVLKYISRASGLLQTQPLLRDYDFLEVDRKVLIDYAYKRALIMAKKEEEYLNLLESDINKGDYTFIDIYNTFKFRVRFREKELATEDLFKKDLIKTKYKEKTHS